MATDAILKDFLASRSDVNDAKRALSSAKGKLAELQNALAIAPAASKASVQADIKAAKAEADKAKAAFDSTVAAAKDYYNKNQESIAAKSNIKKKETAQSNVAGAEAQIAAMKKAGFDTTALERQLAQAKAQANAPFEVSPPPGGTVGGTNAGTGNTPTVRDYATEAASAAKFLYGKSDAERKQIAESLNNAGYKVPTNGKYSDQLVAQYQAAIAGNQMRNTQLGLNQPLEEFLIAKKGEQAGLGGAGGAGSTAFNRTIFSDTDAANYINSEVRQFLNRDATPKEISDLTKQLQKAQKDQPDKVTVDANGNRTVLQGVNPQGFLDNLIKALPEYAAKQAGKAATQAENVINTARANGIDPTQEQINTWNSRIKNGENPDVINHEIRTIASLGQPDSIKKMLATGTNLDTIYAPYKQYMQSILEVPASQIDLKDPALRMAIGPDKEMNLYDYQKALRQDPRWQYTENAKQDVSNSVQKVLQDFGFMG